MHLKQRMQTWFWSTLIKALLSQLENVSSIEPETIVTFEMVLKMLLETIWIQPKNSFKVSILFDIINDIDENYSNPN